MAFSRTLHVVGCHSSLPMWVITGGVPKIPGNSVYEQMRYLEKHDDQIRKLVLQEPRGYPPSCANLIVPPKDPRADAGYIIMEQVEYPLMSGSNTIAVATVLLELGFLPMQEPVTNITLEAPAGLIGIKADCKNGKVTNVTFTNVPAFAAHLDQEIDVPHLGKVRVDVAWGGMFYAIADVRQFPHIKLEPKYGAEIARIGSMIRQAAIEQLPVKHPHYPEMGITISQLSGPTEDPNADWKNAVIMASGDLDWDNPSTWTGVLDRSPCGTGTSAKMATLYAKGELGLNKPFRHQGTLGTVYTGELIEAVEIEGGIKAVVPTIGGQAWIYSIGSLVLDPTDPFTEGFTLGDLWA